jgi:hypothetical protein
MASTTANDHVTRIANSLRVRFHERFEAYEEPYRVRLHRALSWLARADREDGDPDARFIFLWIAFNAAYAHEFGDEQDERSVLEAFFARLVEADAGARLHAILFERYSGPIRTLVDNRFVFAPFWRAMRNHDASDAWAERFAKAKQAAMKSVLERDTVRLLCIVFDRLYVLRCQLVHGGATWNSQVNRAQVQDGARLLGSLVPPMLELMIEHPGLELGAIAYPVVRS